jgi:hypothetical protein
MSDLFSMFGFAFDQPKVAKPVLTVDLMSDIPAQALIRALQECGLTIKEQEKTGRLLICKAEPKAHRMGSFLTYVGEGDEKQKRRKSKGRGN